MKTWRAVLAAGNGPGQRWWIASFIVAVPAIVLANFLLFDRVFYYFDFEVQWVPLHYFTRAAELGGHNPLWNPYVMLGFPQLAESQAGVLYPLNLLFNLLPRQEYALAWLLYLHLVLAATGTWLLARRVHLKRIPALHAAFCFALSGFMFAQMSNYNITLAASYLPLKLYLLTCYFQDRQPRYLLFFAAVFGVELLISHPHTSFITSAVCGIYFCTLLWFDRKSAHTHLSLFAGSVALAIMLAAAQLLPTWELSRLTWRASGLDYDGVTSFSSSPGQYLTALFPMLFGGQSIGYSGGDYFEELFFYCGTIGMLLALFGLVHWVRRRDNRYIGILAVTGFIGFMLSLGANNPFIDPFRWLIHVPGFNLFRVPARWSLPLCLAVAMLSAWGLQAYIAALQSRRYRAIALQMTLTVVAAPLLLWALVWLDPNANLADLWHKTVNPPQVYYNELTTIDHFLYAAITTISPLWLYLGLSSVLLLGVALAACRLPARYCGALILACAVIDLGTVDRPMNASVTSDFFSNVPPHIEALRRTAGVFRVISDDSLPNLQSANNYTATLYRFYSAKGYAPIKLNSYILIEDHLQDEDLLDYIGVKYRIRQRDDGGIVVDERRNVFPRAFVLPNHAASETRQSAFETFLHLPEADRKSWAIVQTDDLQDLNLPTRAVVDTTLDSDTVNAAYITEYQHDRVVIRGHTRQAGFLVLTDTFYPGWNASLNGVEALIVPVQGAFRGVYVDKPGDFTIEMHYAPMSFSLGSVISLSGIVIALLLGVYLHRREAAAASPAETSQPSVAG